MKSVTDTYTTSEIDGGKVASSRSSWNRRRVGRKKSAVNIDPVMLNFKEKLKVVKTTKGTLSASAQDLQAKVDEQSEQVQLQCELIHLTIEKLDDFMKRLWKNI